MHRLMCKVLRHLSGENAKQLGLEIEDYPRSNWADRNRPDSLMKAGDQYQPPTPPKQKNPLTVASQGMKRGDNHKPPEEKQMSIFACWP